MGGARSPQLNLNLTWSYGSGFRLMLILPGHLFASSLSGTSERRKNGPVK
jgi:hypothetical protein